MYNYIWVTGILGIVLLGTAIVTAMKDMMYCERTKENKIKYLVPNSLLLICSIGWFVMTVCLYLSIQNQL